MYGNGKVTKQTSDGPQEQRIIRRGGMIIEFDYEIIMDDGVLRCDIYRPCSKESCPAVVRRKHRPERHFVLCRFAVMAAASIGWET